ncbi:MAG TPA: hypothetical protein PK771_14140, partial [Spirochaetota bacterium]|nr:hypothetical protein [Spirochaetota bacterium]
ANSDDIPITKDLSEGAGKIKDEEMKKKNREKKDKDKKQKDNDNIDDESDTNSIISKDKNIGTRVDIIG